MKEFRARGYEATVGIDDGMKLEYVKKAGLRELLSDPVYVTILGMPLSVALDIVSSYLYDLMKRRPTGEALELQETDIVMEFDEAGKKLRYGHRGNPISDERFASLLESLDERARRYDESQQRVPADPNRPVPIYLEHAGKIVGWGRVTVDDTGLKVEDAQFTDDETSARIESGELKGFSIGAVVRRSRCSICDKDYVSCNHVGGREYDGVQCRVHLDELDPAEISIVKDPVQPLAKLHRGRLPE
jgi:hypothetical protein